MPFELVKEMFETLPFEQQNEVVDFVFFLYKENNKKNPKGKSKFPFDVFSGGMNYIAENFDDTPEGFEDYI